MRGKVTLINSASILVALIFSFLSVTVYITFFLNPTIRDYYNSRHILYERFHALSSEDNLEEQLGVHLPEHSAFVVMELENFQPVYSQPPGLDGWSDAALHWTPADFVRQLSKKWSHLKQDYYSESITNRQAGLALIYFSMKPVNPEHRSGRWIFVMILTGSTILAASIMSTIFLQKSTRSIDQLEKATQEIAGGNLDFSLDPKGRDEIANLARSFNAMRISLKEEMAIRNRFLMGVSHDLKTPLTTIEGYIEAIKDGLISQSELPDVMDRLQRKSRLLESRILELITYVKMETGEWRLSLESVQLQSVLEDLDEVYSEEVNIVNRKFRLDNRISGDVLVRMDTGLFVRMMENLVNNAMKYSAAHSEIVLKIEKQSDGVCLSVINRGEVIPDDKIELLFEPFFRVSNSRNAPGFGLGLSIVKSIVDAHGWAIRLTSTEEDGTAFRVMIPQKSD